MLKRPLASAVSTGTRLGSQRLVVVFGIVSLLCGCTRSSSQPAITVVCAAVMRAPVEEIARQYQAEHDVTIEMRFGGSNTLLSEVRISKSGDVFIAADSAYTAQLAELELSGPGTALATITPVLLVGDGVFIRESGTQRQPLLADLPSDQLRVAIANPDTAAIGRGTQQVLQSVGLWEDVLQSVHERGVMFPNVNAVANAVALGSVDVGVVWDATARLHPSLGVVRDARWGAGRGTVEIAILTACQNRAVVEDFKRYASTDSRSRRILNDHGFRPIE